MTFEDDPVCDGVNGTTRFLCHEGDYDPFFYRCLEQFGSGQIYFALGSFLLVLGILGFCYLKYRFRNEKIFLDFLHKTTIGFLILFTGWQGITLITIACYMWSFYATIIVILISMPLIAWLIVRSVHYNVNLDKHEMIELAVGDHFQDFNNSSLASITCLALLQFILCLIFLCSIFAENHSGPKFCVRTVIYYCIGMNVQFMYIFHHFINALLDKEKFWDSVEDTKMFCCLSEINQEQSHWKKISRYEVRYRRFLYRFINGCVMLWVIALIPIQITVSEGVQDVVLNIVAAYFITELDDLNRDAKITLSTNMERFRMVRNTKILYKWKSNISIYEVKSHDNLFSSHTIRSLGIDDYIDDYTLGEIPLDASQNEGKEENESYTNIIREVKPSISQTKSSSKAQKVTFQNQTSSNLSPTRQSSSLFPPTRSLIINNVPKKQNVSVLSMNNAHEGDNEVFGLDVPEYASVDERSISSDDENCDDDKFYSC